MPDWLGKTIGKVRIDKYLAHAGMAEVYLGTHLTLDRPVAVKVLHGYIEENNDLGECLRFPPLTNGTRREPPSARAENTVFPVTAMVRWCGEWATAEAVL